jgi:hypothetical protein
VAFSVIPKIPLAGAWVLVNYHSEITAEPLRRPEELERTGVSRRYRTGCEAHLAGGAVRRFEFGTIPPACSQLLLHSPPKTVQSAITGRVRDCRPQSVLGEPQGSFPVAGIGPSLLGYFGSRWEADPLDDLAQDAYLRAIATRLRGLQANLRQSGDIEKLVRKNLRTFVGERQAAFDPVGYALFQNIKAAVVELSELGALTRLDPASEAISGDSQFEIAGRQPGGVPDEHALKAALTNSGKVMEDIEIQARVGRPAQERIVQAIRLLPGQNIARFTVRTLKQALSALIQESGIRPQSARTVSFSDLQVGFPENLRTEPPPAGYQEVESYEELVAAIQRAIEDVPRSGKVKARLQRLLAHFAEAISSGESDRQESLDDLADHFGVPRSTLHDDFQSLRSLVGRVMTANRKD